MALWKWRTDDSGRVHVNDGTGEALWTLKPSQIANEMPLVMRWAPDVAALAAESGTPVPWVLGMIYTESRGNPKAQNPCCKGLLALHAKYYGKPGDDLLDGATNLRLGMPIIAKHVKQGFDLPAIASMHNAGRVPSGPHPAGNVWGMRQEEIQGVRGGYIEQVVRASNSAIQLLSSGAVPVAPLPSDGGAGGAAPATSGASGATKAFALVGASALAYVALRMRLVRK